jgi:hypothetical protein
MSRGVQSKVEMKLWAELKQGAWAVSMTLPGQCPYFPSGVQGSTSWHSRLSLQGTAIGGAATCQEALAEALVKM